MKIVSVGTALPEHRYEQRVLLAALAGLHEQRPGQVDRLRSFHEHMEVEHRCLVAPLESYLEPRSFGATNDLFITAALDLGERALREALERAALPFDAVDALFVASVTGIASPSLDARLMNRVPLRADTKRVPIFGLGCVAGAAGIARAADYVRAFPGHVAVLLCVELCSLTFQRDDLSVANMVSTGLFGDGAAAVVVAGAERRGLDATGPRVVATRSVFYADTEEVMGWNVSERGFQIVLSARVPELARTRLPGDVDAFLYDHGLSRREIKRWICHPGGPKVLDAIGEGLGLAPSELELSRRMLREQGNLSSASVLMVLDATLRESRPAAGEHALLLAMGPGFCSELVLMRF